MTEGTEMKSGAGAPQVGIVMGSDSDLAVMKEAAAILKKFEIPYKMTVASAHRSPERAAEFARSAGDRGPCSPVAPGRPPGRMARRSRWP